MSLAINRKIRFSNKMRPEQLFSYFAETSTLIGVGPRTAEVLSRAMGPKLLDLLFTPPASFIDRSYNPKISEIIDNSICTLEVTVGSHSIKGNKNQPIRIRVFDKTGDLTLCFFRAKEEYLKKILPVGSKRIISGKAQLYNSEINMIHPDYILPVAEKNRLPIIETLYPLTEGLTQKVARKSILNALEKISTLPEWLDKSIINKYNWPKFNEALIKMHSPVHPSDIKLLAPPRQRLAYDELLAKQIAIALVRNNNQKKIGISHNSAGKFIDEILNVVNFEPTKSQEIVFKEIKKDMSSTYRMTRLLQGDVGSGKTFVAAMACAYAAESGSQIALMAPTEILARQHLTSLKLLLDPLGLTVEALTGRDKGLQRKALETGLKEGYIDVVIGTHALFQNNTIFKKLGLVIIDEQHRFGVHDRFKLTEKGLNPDLLVMTATPIPRTLALASYGDLDISTITQKPAGRKPIGTHILPMQKLDEVIAGIKRAITKGQQVYWVCPLVEESELIELSSVMERYSQLKEIFGNRVKVLHGRLKPHEKEAISNEFKSGKYDILIATTVIEVGIDVPNASIIIIEHAERFGLAQLHQLRGRVGRGSETSSCLLLYKNPLSKNGRLRLEIMKETEDGFLIAEKDLELRGSGDLLGSKQSGLPEFRIADIDKHKSLLDLAAKDAKSIINKDPMLESHRGESIRTLLYLFEQDFGIALMDAG